MRKTGCVKSSGLSSSAPGCCAGARSLDRSLDLGLGHPGPQPLVVGRGVDPTGEVPRGPSAAGGARRCGAGRRGRAKAGDKVRYRRGTRSLHHQQDDQGERQTADPGQIDTG